MFLLTVYEGSLSSISLPTFVISWLFDNSHSNRCEVISYFGFDLHFPNNSWCWTSFHVPVDICMSSLEKRLFRSFAHLLNQAFLFLMLSCMSCLYILDIDPLSVISFANIFSHSVGWIFHFVNSFLCCAKAVMFN